MASAWCSFLDAVTPGPWQSWQEGLGARPCTCQLVDSQISDSHSRLNLGGQRVPVNPDITQRRPQVPVREESSTSESKEEFQDSRGSPAPGDLEDPTPTLGIFSPSSQTGVPHTVTTFVGDPVSSGNVDMESNTEVGISQADLIEEAKFYQDMAINYQNAYEALLAQQAELQGKFEAQSRLIQEASAAIDAAEGEAKIKHQELLHVR